MRCIHNDEFSVRMLWVKFILKTKLKWTEYTSQFSIAAAARCSRVCGLLLLTGFIDCSSAKVFKKPIVSERPRWFPWRITKSSVLQICKMCFTEESRMSHKIKGKQNNCTRADKDGLINYSIDLTLDSTALWFADCERELSSVWASEYQSGTAISVPEILWSWYPSTIASLNLLTPLNWKSKHKNNSKMISFTSFWKQE